MNRSKSIPHFSASRICTLSAQTALILIYLVVSPPKPVNAQNVNVAIGYTNMPGRIGDVGSDKGIAARVGIDIRRGSHIALGLEAGLDYLNAHRIQNTTTCYEVGTCHFDVRARDTGWSVGTILRVYPGSFQLRPYGLIGLGYLKIREHEVQFVVDDAGNPLPGFSYDSTSTDDAAQVHIGAGVATKPSRLPIDFYVEGRATRLFYNYSGGLDWSWSPTVVFGILMGKRS